MKKAVIAFILGIFVLSVCGAKEYDVLTPPTLSVMDFEVNIEEPLSGDTALDKSYYGQLINHTLVTVLIKANNDIELLVPRADHFREDRMDEARFFPPLFKLYDKKYVETALAENNYTTEDLYQKDPNAFNFPELDFIVLGNVFEGASDTIGVNVRVLNTYRGEELFSYTMKIRKDMNNLYEECRRVAEGIIFDVLENYCSQVIVRSPEPSEILPAEVPAHELFCQSNQERDNTDEIISYNDTFKKSVYENTYYWVLPGSYVITVYNHVSKSVQEIPVTISPREIKMVQLLKKHFEAPSGSITIKGIPPTVSYSFRIQEIPRDAEFIWEIGRNPSSTLQDHRFTFIKGEFDRDPTEMGPRWVYSAASNDLRISNLPIAKYRLTITPVAESISKESITGIVRISSRSIETSAPVEANLKVTKDFTVDISAFELKTDEEIEAYRSTRVTFIFNPAFDGESIELWSSDGTREGYLSMTNIEKLIVEDSYSQEEWDTLLGADFWLYKGPRSYTVPLEPSEMWAREDTVIVVDFNTIKPQPPRIEATAAAAAAPASTSSQDAAAAPATGSGQKTIWDILFGPFIK